MGPLKRFRVAKIETLEDVKKTFDDLEQYIRVLGFSLDAEEGGGGGGGGAPDDSAYVLTVADVDLPNARVLVGGTNTAVNTGTPGQVRIDVAGAPPTGSAGGHLQGTYPNPTVRPATTGQTGIVQLTNHLGGTSTAPTVRNATTGQTGIVQLANHLAGTATAPTVRSATTTQTGIVELATDGESAANLAVQANDGRLSDSRTPTGSAGGHLAGTYPNPTVRSATTGQTGIVQLANYLGGTATAPTVRNAAGSLLGAVQLNADVQGSATAMTVARIRGRNVSIAPPSTDDLYRWDGSSWSPWSPKYIQASLSGVQTSNLANGNHVEFDTTDLTSGHITLSTGPGQANGIFTLPVGTYELLAQVHVTPNSATVGSLSMRWFDITAGVFAGPFGRTMANNATLTQTPGNFALGLVDVPSGTKTVELQMLAVSNITNIQSGGTGVIIKALR